MISAWILAGYLVAAPSDRLVAFAKKVGHSPATTCKAVLNLTIEDGEVPPCEKGRRTGIHQIFPDDVSEKELARLCRANYTIYKSGSRLICQCNNPRHSELVVLDGHKNIRAFKNLKNPCNSCYLDIIKTMIAEKRFSGSESLLIEFKKRANPTEHHNYRDDCLRYKSTDPDDFKD